jgi:hypothetical protein
MDNEKKMLLAGMIVCLFILIYCIYMIYEGYTNPTYSAGCYIFNQYENISTRNETEYLEFMEQCMYYYPNIDYQQNKVNDMINQELLKRSHNISY